MRNFEIRNDGPPDKEWFGSFDGFQTEFSISQLVEEKFSSTNKSSFQFPNFEVAEAKFVEWWRKESSSQIMCGSLMRKFYNIIVGNKKH